MTRHNLLCDALRQLGANISELTTAEVVTACRAAVPDADSDEILAALRAASVTYTRKRAAASAVLDS